MSPPLAPSLLGALGGDPGGALRILVLLTFLTLVPALLLLTTAFTRIVVVLSFLRSALGTQQAPPNPVLIGLALFLAFFVMQPTLQKVNTTAIQPYLAGQATEEQAMGAAAAHLDRFMLQQTRQKDLALFISLSHIDPPEKPEDTPFWVIAPAFAISELRTAFEMGFLLYVPFLVIDLVVASTLLSMGMMMFPPSLLSLPFKILLFVLVDGWHLVVQSLIQSFY